MNGERFYTFKPKPGVRFFALDSNYMDQAQLDWLEKELAASGSDWKIAFFHHPLYSSGGTHGSDVELREQLEPLFLKYGVDVVFAGHEHFYERIKPQKGIYYFMSGGAGEAPRRATSAKTSLTAKGFDTGYHFMLIELGKDALHFQAINEQGKVVDSGALPRFSDADKKKMATSRRRPSARGRQPGTRLARLTYPLEQDRPGGVMSLLKRLFGKNEPPKQRIRVCVECGMPLAEHKEWCSILRAQREMKPQRAQSAQS